MTNPTDTSPIDELEFVGEDAVSDLHPGQTVIFAEHLEDVIDALRTWAKSPERRQGYAEGSLSPMVRRLLQSYEYVWKTDGVTLQLSTADANTVVDALVRDDLTMRNGDPFKQGSKRKFGDTLDAYFRIQGTEWDRPTKFRDEKPELDSDPFSKTERRELKQASFDYKSPPSYSNVSPQERDRWSAKLAQDLGKPKEKVGPDDWTNLQRSWKIPSIVHFAFDAGARAALINRLERNLLHLSSEQVEIPEDTAVKNNTDWEIDLTSETTEILKKWLEERARKPKYDDTDHLWLNRRGNPYRSATLNNLLRNLIGCAGIESGGRKLTWHSIRHSTGMYVYDQCQDLAMVAEILRLETLESARIYSHPTPEAKRQTLESIARG